MEIEEIISSIKNFDDVIKRESREYLTTGYKLVSYQDKDDDKKFITNGLKRFINKSDKIIFLLEAVNYLNNELSDINERVDYSMHETDYSQFSVWEHERSQDNDQLKRSKANHETRIFYAVRELEKLGVSDLNKNAFSQSEATDLTRKINALLIKIDELFVGQEVIFNFIEELKGDLKDLNNDFPLGKKRWYQRFSGIIASYLGTKGADAIYDLIKPDIMKIVQDVIRDKLLH